MKDMLTNLLSQAAEFEKELPPLQLPEGHPDHRDGRPARLADWIDHTLLKPEATPDQIDALCQEALAYGFAAVCINPIYVPRCRPVLEGSPVRVCTVVGFPLGATLTGAKVDETHRAMDAGAQEIDMVIPVGMLRGGQYQVVAEDIAAVIKASHARGALVKVILEMALLNRAQKIIACLLSQAAGADFVKTSTGFGPGGATLEDVELMRRVVGPRIGVKAAGGIRSLADARAMLQVGATRLGTSAGVKIVQEAG